jgi:hypothetical protein
MTGSSKEVLREVSGVLTQQGFEKVNIKKQELCAYLATTSRLAAFAAGEATADVDSPGGIMRAERSSRDKPASA